MAAATAPINTDEIPQGNLLYLPVAAATKIFAGTLAGIDSAGRAVPASDTAGLKVGGLAQETVDNSAGAAGALSINLKKGVFKFDNSATAAIDADDVDKVCYVEDDHTVAESTVNSVVAGIVIGIDAADGKVIVDTRFALHIERLGAALAGTNNGNGVLRVARATFDPSGDEDLRTVAAHGLGVSLPAGAIGIGFFYDVTTTFTSADDSATIAVHAEAAGDLIAAIAISDATNMWDAGRHAGKPGYPNFGADAAHDSQVEVAALFAATFLKTTVAREITATVAVQALTAGKATFYVLYVQG